MKTQLQNLKGFRDFLPADAGARLWLKNKLIEIFEIWGFEPLETPTLEPLELFTGQIGEDEKLFFKFKDSGGRDVALRYDQTVPTCRVIGQYFNQITLPFKRYQIQPTFRAEKPQKGRYREFTQCDADIFGIASPIADAETIALSLDIYRRLGFRKAVVRINDRELLRNIPYKALVAIDKLKKIGEEGVLKEMINRDIEPEKAKEYLTFVKALKPDETITVILDYLTKYEFKTEWFVFDPTIARSFSYSMGPIWEVEIPGFAGGSVLGGERYDTMVEKITDLKIPGTGFGLGFDRTLEAAIQNNLIPKKLKKNTVLVTIFNPDVLQKSLEIASNLRENGICVDVYPDANVKLEKQLKYANRKTIPLVLILGPNEIAKHLVQIKNMKEHSAQTVPFDDVTKTIRKMLEINE